MEYEKLMGKGAVEPPAGARSRALAARERQARRFAGSAGVQRIIGGIGQQAGYMPCYAALAVAIT